MHASMVTETPRRDTASVCRSEIEALIASCTWPSEAFWRTFEFGILNGRALIRSPAFELGCGDGAFTQLLGVQIDKGIDLNPRAVERARARVGVYAEVECRDVRTLADEGPGRFRTVFANSVLEHIPGLEQVLASCARLLARGGQLVATVPLADMNSHLLSPNAHYVAWRGRQLQHLNLWPVDRWRSKLNAAGFRSVTFERYLDPASCRYWDALDVPAGLGIGRFCLGPALRKFVDLSVPQRAKSRVVTRLAQRFDARYAEAKSTYLPGCAALIVASVPDVDT
jgi:SAM-dependent methyltransferase